MPQTIDSCRTPEERERLILQHMKQVRWIAASVHERLPGNVLQEDLISAGTIGLIAAVDHFDASRNTSLRTYAEHRIRGAILDWLRSMDSVPAQTRRRAKAVQSAMDAAQQRTQCTPSEEDIALELGLTLPEYRKELCDIARVNALRCIPERAELLPSCLAERKSLQRLLAQAITFLPKLERTVVGLYYVEELSLAEIGRVLGVHASRVSQLKWQAVLRLRSYLAKKWPSGRRSSAVTLG